METILKNFWINNNKRRGVSTWLWGKEFKGYNC